MRLLRGRYDILKILFFLLVQRHSHQLTARGKIDLVEINPAYLQCEDVISSQPRWQDELRVVKGYSIWPLTRWLLRGGRKHGRNWFPSPYERRPATKPASGWRVARDACRVCAGILTRGSLSDSVRRNGARLPSLVRGQSLCRGRRTRRRRGRIRAVRDTPSRAGWSER